MQDAQNGRPLREGSVWFIWSIWFVYLISFTQPKKPDKPDRPDNGLLTLADFFSILLVLVHDGFEVAATDHLSLKQD